MDPKATTAVKYGAKATARDIGMGKTISGYIVNFAKTGDPAGEDLPAWPRYDRASDLVMDFAPNGMAVAEKDPLASQIDAAAPAAR